ncbi:G2/mitotic-specific cyclin-B3 isoform X1 [Sipha flava]|uniref:G2/mitotic-specific cyclin-B3 isoform X1 n=1 Tax=Sipha flava TaxID=143950 RepID=A0A8B8G6T0_9HEMI|nr:G2/mitotic-specific cyclin-B3 isoform X1 [Sipha flava]
MPPITRNQLKKCSHKTEPYSKENRPSDKRNALSDLVIDNVVKETVVSIDKEEVIKSSNENVFIKDKILPTENISEIPKLKNEFPKPIIASLTEKKLITNEPARLSLTDSSVSTNTSYQTANNESVNSKYSASSEELYTTVSSRSSIPFEINQSELYQSAVQEVTCNEDEIFETDQAHWNNFMYVGCYAREIFKYLRQREDQFNVTDYINNQNELTPRHRAIVVNWLVHLQEMYGLNHEVLYMAVKIIDLYLSKNEISKDKFQLLASGAILIASKIDEREPGFPYDLVKQCKFIYTEDELFVTERELAKALNYDINVPLSYVFLRRFARCMMCQMFLLTLARYILECSLLDYTFVTLKDSLKAAAALYLAFKMCFKTINAKDLKKFTGYDVKEIESTVIALNNMLHTQCPDLSAVKQKYLHETFYQVASKSLLSNSKLTFD